ncbi:retropepsin-like aspartic protease family protein [Qipengyuania vesicularis]|uniref:retropepsin-like aspartic protease family protein n=1 Tax=Qipengyuania vesicularis TaxID=2867232 RepID=UPI001C87C00F|nr:retropepsin-like aspartic protease [Qipengyuania vesicularis]MBX7526134.1 retropepsin-like domain-containing protein [Qipengyuania vesicularis]
MNKIWMCSGLAAAVLLAGCGHMSASAGEFDLAAALSEEGYVSIPLEKLPTGHEIVPVEVNGVSGTFLLDSGAQGTIIDEQWAARYYLTPEGVDGHDKIAGATGHTAMRRAEVRSLSISGSELPTNFVMVGNVGPALETLGRMSGREIQGIVGQDLLSRHDGVIDVGNSTLYLRLD